ncbi:MAG: UDP-N-acetylmuramate dehydrogenase [Acidimicrobiales bacterium]
MAALGAALDRPGAVEVEGSLAPWTTYRVGGPAAVLVHARTLADLEAAHTVVASTGVDVLVIGRGSNLLVADAGFDGVVVHLDPDGFADIELDGTSVIAGGGALLPVVARRTAKAGLTGFEWAVGVPGSVGGAVRMNAGGHGSDIAATLAEVSLFDLRLGGPVARSADDLDLAYRSSNLGPEHVVLFARFDLAEGDQAAAEAELSEIVRWRREHQPGGANAGSVFTNPEGDSAGRLIDAAGLKGHRIGTAEVSRKHANFIQADPDGSGDDVAALIDHVRAEVRSRFGVTLHPENRLIGFDRQVPKPGAP